MVIVQPTKGLFNYLRLTMKQTKFCVNRQRNTRKGIIMLIERLKKL